jgi:HAE1 family hydrophobic/amphiphilic exporter-1
VAPLAAEPLSRAEAVAAALAANPEVRKSRANVQLLEGRGREALADALPELNLYGTATRFRDPSLLNSPNFESFPPEFADAFAPITTNLYEGFGTLRQTLFSFKLGRALKGAKYGISAGREQARGVERTVALDTIRAYNLYLLNLERVRVGEKAVRQKEQHLAMAGNRRAAGVATDLEVLRFEVDLANARAQLDRLKGDADFSRGELNAAMVRPIDAAIEPTDTFERHDLDVALDQVLGEALRRRPELAAAELSVKAYEEFVGVAKGEGRPHLDFVANWGWSVRRPRNFFEGDFRKWNAAVTLTVPVFDGFRTAGRVAQARAQRDQVEQDRIALENRVRLEAKSALDALKTAGRVVGATALNVTQAQKAADMTQANYKLGAATSLDVLDAQAALTLAESLHVQALHDHANARAALLWVMGQDPLDTTAVAPAATATDGER